MSERSELISKLAREKKSRTAYIKAKLGVLVPSQIRALRLKSDMPRQSDLANEAEMKQSRISMIESPGAANVTLDTLARLAAVFNVGVVVKFVPFSEMLRWENEFSQDTFNVTRLLDDTAFIAPEQQDVSSKGTVRHVRFTKEVEAGTGVQAVAVPGRSELLQLTNLSGFHFDYASDVSKRREHAHSQR